jgi:hypothetical protein
MLLSVGIDARRSDGVSIQCLRNRYAEGCPFRLPLRRIVAE